MHIHIADETSATERRVAFTPDAVQRLLKKFPALCLTVQPGAGVKAGYPDALYVAAGAAINADGTAADIHLRLTPSPVPTSALTVGLNPTEGTHVLALEKLPRTSRAQALDVLSSQANIAGYAAVLMATQHFPRLMPMFMTSAGSSRPANVLVLGVGVAGLQAIATARRLGAQVFAYDVRPEVHEQILSLGAKPLAAAPQTDKSPAGQGGYATELTPEQQQAQQQALATAIAAADIVITTAQVPGRPAPVLVSEAALATMKPGSVLLDMATVTNARQNLTGGNTPASVLGQTVVTENGVTILAPENLPSHVPGDASRFYAQNLVNLLSLLLKDTNGQLALDFSDELIAAMRSEFSRKKAS